MKDKITKTIVDLLKVKTLVTLALTGLFIAMACYGVITGDQILNIFTMVISFYFCTQANKE